MFDLNLVLVDFYISRGIEFLGEAKIGTHVRGAGAKWSAPEPGGLPEERSRFQAEDVGVSFPAARALLNKTQKVIANETGLSVATVKALERGDHWAESSKTMQDYYEQNHVEFLGWSDAATKLFYGVGVRWRPSLKISS